MSIMIRIKAAQDGWSLQGDTLQHGMMFLSGAEAETAARALAQRYSAAGQPTEIEVFLRDGSLAGRYVTAPQAGELVET